jgi:hypothetical protein
MLLESYINGNKIPCNNFIKNIRNDIEITSLETIESQQFKEGK